MNDIETLEYIIKHKGNCSGLIGIMKCVDCPIVEECIRMEFSYLCYSDRLIKAKQRLNQIKIKALGYYNDIRRI